MKTIAFWHLDCWTAQVLDGDPGQSRGIHCPFSRVRCDLVLIRTGGSEDRSMLLACRGKNTRQPRTQGRMLDGSQGRPENEPTHSDWQGCVRPNVDSSREHAYLVQIRCPACPARFENKQVRCGDGDGDRPVTRPAGFPPWIGRRRKTGARTPRPLQAHMRAGGLSGKAAQ